MDRADYEIVAVPRLAPLAWLFEQPSGAAGRLFHGPSVSVWDRGFFEGCAAVESPDDLPGAVEVFGSGMIHDGASWTVVTPSHTLESLYVYAHENGSFSVSNSLAFLAAHHGLLPPAALDYGEKLISICLGIDDHARSLFRTEAGEVARLSFDNLEVRSGGTLRRFRKPPSPAFSDYGSYVSYLLGTLRSAFGHASGPGSVGNYRPLATCSTGYDSTCAAALAADLGCTEAITLTNARGGLPDSGREVGEQLGLRVHEVERADVTRMPFERLAPFFVTGTGAEDASFAGFGPRLAGRVLLTGFHGDKIWAPRYRANAVLTRGDASGCSLQEFRLRTDFHHVPVPMIGARQHADVRRISRSREMAPFRLGTRYDRPVPRRVVEERGVERSSFGQHKKAASTFTSVDEGALERIAASDIEAWLPESWRETLDRVPRELARWRARRGWVTRTRPTPLIGSVVRRLVTSHWSLYGQYRPDASVRFAAALLAVGRSYREAGGGEVVSRF